MAKAVGLLSGGLDSILAIKMILEQGVEVIGVCFTSPFFDNSKYAKSITDKFEIELRVVNFGIDYIEMVKNPKYGYGKNFNPCIDCHTYMLRQAKKLMEGLKADFVFTGEVLNERPMSQNRQALQNIEREADLIGRLVRPLSAQLLEPTIPETTKVIDRERLCSISGRSRKPQIAMAKKYGIVDFPQPAGGCLLTDETFSNRLKDAFDHKEDSINDLQLLKIGRHFRLKDSESAKIVVGRNELENKRINELANDTDLLLLPIEIVGPTVLVRNYKDKYIVLPIAAGLCARYSDKGVNRLVKVKVNGIIIETDPLDESLINKLRI